jgi:hypothetical protein
MESSGGQAYSKNHVQWSVLECQIQDEFGAKQYNNAEDPLCKACVKRLEEQGTPYRCTRSRQRFVKESFAASFLKHDAGQKVCRGCVAHHVRACCICKKDKPSTDFANSMWPKMLSQSKCEECVLGRTCCVCEKPQTECKFVVGEWIKPDAQRTCIQCAKHRCSMCKKRKANCGFLVTARNAANYLCYDCDRKRCSRCNKEKCYKDFSHAVWDLDVGSPELLCAECVAGQRQCGFWKCSNRRCGKQKPHSEVGRAITKLGKGVKGDSKQCDARLERREEELAEMTRSSLEHVQQKRKQ